MIVLGFDTSTSATVVGLMLADGATLQARDDPNGERRPGHATRLLPLASELLQRAGIGWQELERIAVGVGPGTFTGLRIGVATARGLSQSLGIQLVGVSSLRALAHAADRNPVAGALAAIDVSTASRGAAGSNANVAATGVLSVIDARRGEVFVGVYHGERQLIAPCALAPDGIGELLGRADGELLAQGDRELGHRTDTPASVERWIAVGDGATRYRDALRRRGVLVPDDRSPLHRIDARAICGLAIRAPASPATRVSAGPQADGSDGPLAQASPLDLGIVPNYTRRPDAEIALEGVPTR
jgi:tRNA threonylcarbamoyladenosine biosynthesis protein TsaB